MAEITDIRINGRGGQGAVTASRLLAEAAILEGQYVHAFPNFGPERAGAPVTSYARISPEPFTEKTEVYYPDIVIVTDPSLLGMVDLTSGAKDDAIFLMNTTFDTALVREKLSLGDKKIYSLDAYTIASDELGRAIPNVPMVAALVKVIEIMDLKKFKEKIKVALGKKLRPEVVEMNMKTIDRAFKEVKEG